jgi:arylsulfatase A-like enzyme
MFRNRRVFTQKALIEPGRLTLASLLKRAGYRTAMIGKWHLSFEGGGLDPGGAAGRGKPFDYAQPLRGGPIDHGFDSFFGMHASLDLPPYFFIEDDRVVQAPAGAVEEHHTPGVRSIQGEFWRGGAIASDFRHKEVLSLFAGKAVKYLESSAGTDQPFFLYFALTAPHPPWLPELRFRGKSGAGMYGDFVMQVDEVVGRVISALEKAGKTRDTLVIFTSDNGPTWYQADVQKHGHDAVAGFRGMKADVWGVVIGCHSLPAGQGKSPRVLRAGSSSLLPTCWLPLPV